MKKMHNSMTLASLIFTVLMAVALTVFYIFADFTLPLGLYITLMGMLSLFIFIIILGERSFRKSDLKINEKIGTDYNCAEETKKIMTANILKTTLIIIVALSIIGGFVALCYFYTYIGVAVFVIFCAILLFSSLRINKKITTVEKYIASKNKKIQPTLKKIDKLILQTDSNAISFIDDIRNVPIYCHAVIDPQNTNQVLYYPLIAIQALIGNKICIYPQNQDFFSTFKSELQGLNTNNISEIIISADEYFDYSLIKDIVLFNKSLIKSIKK